MGDAAKVIVIERDELRELVRDAVKEALGERRPTGAQAGYLELKEVADLLGVEPRTVRSYVRRDGLPVVRLGTQTMRFDRDELAAWLSARGSKHGAQAGKAAEAIERLNGLDTKSR
jgi:excisionase family DNA binding protein